MSLGALPIPGPPVLRKHLPSHRHDGRTTAPGIVP